MSVSSVSSSNGSTTSTSTSAATSSLMSNYDTFLKILMTQIQTQNPLDPMDTQSFTQQLVQYSSVEQQLQTNSKLDDLLTTMTTSSALQLVNYLGKDVTAYSDTTKFSDGACTWNLDASAAADDATVTVTNSSGAVVYTTTTNLKEGDNTFSWDGSTKDGTNWSSSSDSYVISVNGTDADGKAISVTTQTSGRVDNVDTSSTQPYLSIDGHLVPLSAVISIGV